MVVHCLRPFLLWLNFLASCAAATMLKQEHASSNASVTQALKSHAMAQSAFM
jgi:hypothetical protein